MKKLFLFLFIFICAKIQAQTYNPSQGKVAINLPMGLNLGASLDSRSMFYDATNFVYRAYTDTGEVNRYLNLAKYRTGFFPIWVNTGGTLAGGVITGGTNIPWIYKDGVGNGNLVRMLFDSTYIYQQLRGKLDTMYTVNDSTVRIQNGNTSYTLLIRGNGGNSLNNYTNNVIFDTATGRLTTKVTGRSDIVTQLFDRLRPSQAGLLRITGTYPFFTFTADSLGFEGTLKKQNTTSQNDSINIGAFRFKFQGTSALGIPWGNTASRPSNPQQFDLRGNLDSLKYEFWNGSNWISIGNGGAGGSGITSLSGDGTASGTGAVTFTLANVNSNIFGSNTFLKFAVNAKGLIVSATAVTSGDITAALGFTPYNATNPAGYGTGNPNANLGSGYRIAIPGTNNLKTLLGSFIILDSSTANSIRIIVDTAALTSNWLINHRDSIIIDTVNGLRRRPGTGTNPDTLYLAYNGGGGSGYNNYVRATSFSILPSNSSSTNRTNFLSMVTTANAQRKNIYIDTTGFQMDSLTISVSNITIFGKDSTTVVGTGTLAGHPIYKLFNVTGKNVVFQNFTIDGGNANLNDRDTTIGIYSQSGYGLNIYGMHFRNLYKAVEVHEVDNFVLDRNVFDSLSFSAGAIYDGTNIRISRNTVRGWGLGNSNSDCFYLGSFTSLGGMHNFEAYGNIIYNNFGSALFVYETGAPTKNIDGFKVYNEYWDAKGYNTGGISVAADYADISGVNPVNFTTKLAVEISAGLYPYIHDINFQNSVLAINSRLEDTTKGLRVERCYFKPTNTSGAQYLIQFGGGNASTGGIGGQGVVNVATFKDNVIDASSGNIQYLVRLFNYAGDASIANDVDISGNTLIQNPGNSYSGGYGFHFNGTGSNRVNLNNNVIRGTFANSAIVFQSGVVNRNLVVDGLKAPNGAFDASLTTTVAPNYKTFNIISDTTKPAQFFINGVTVTPLNGSPNSVLAAPKGSMAIDTATGNVYTKTSGTGTTTWTQLGSGSSSLNSQQIAFGSATNTIISDSSFVKDSTLNSGSVYTQRVSIFGIPRPYGVKKTGLPQLNDQTFRIFGPIAALGAPGYGVPTFWEILNPYDSTSKARMFSGWLGTREYNDGYNLNYRNGHRYYDSTQDIVYRFLGPDNGYGFQLVGKGHPNNVDVYNSWGIIPAKFTWNRSGNDFTGADFWIRGKVNIVDPTATNQNLDSGRIASFFFSAGSLTFGGVPTFGTADSVRWGIGGDAKTGTRFAVIDNGANINATFENNGNNSTNLERRFLRDKAGSYAIGSGLKIFDNINGGVAEAGWLSTANAPGGFQNFDWYLKTTNSAGSFAERMRLTEEGFLGLGTSSPGKILNVSSTTSGVVFPRMNTTQQNAMTPVTGEMIFNTDSSKYRYYNGAAWVTMANFVGGGYGTDTAHIWSNGLSASIAGAVVTAKLGGTLTQATDIDLNSNIFQLKNGSTVLFKQYYTGEINVPKALQLGDEVTTLGSSNLMTLKTNGGNTSFGSQNDDNNGNHPIWLNYKRKLTSFNIGSGTVASEWNVNSVGTLKFIANANAPSSFSSLDLVYEGQNAAGTTAERFRVTGDGAVKAPNLNQTANQYIVHYNKSTGELTYADSATNISGTYTPTVTGITNYASSTAVVCQYMQVDKVVTVSGKVSVKPTTSSGVTTFRITLPVSSNNFTLSYQCAGTGAGIGSGTMTPYVISAASGTQLAEISFIATQSSFEQDCLFTFTYRVL